MIRNIGGSVYTEGNFVYIKHKDKPAIAAGRLLYSGSYYLLVMRKNMTCQILAGNLAWIEREARAVGVKMLPISNHTLPQLSDEEYLGVLLSVIDETLEMGDFSSSRTTDHNVNLARRSKEKLTDFLLERDLLNSVS